MIEERILNQNNDKDSDKKYRLLALKERFKRMKEIKTNEKNLKKLTEDILRDMIKPNGLLIGTNLKELSEYIKRKSWIRKKYRLFAKYKFIGKRSDLSSEISD